MGATGWEYVAAWQGDVPSTLSALHEQIFQEEYAGRGGWASLEEIWNDYEFMGDSGTHTIIDVYEVVDATEEPDYGTMRPLAPERVQHWFGTHRPSLKQYTTLRDEQNMALQTLPGAVRKRPPMLMDEPGMRWTGVYLVLYDADQPSHVAFWGYSGD